MPPDHPRIAVFDNLANSAYILTKSMRRLGQQAELVLDPLDRHVMSDPRWEDLDLELPTDQLGDAAVLPAAELPGWVRRGPGSSAPPSASPAARVARIARTAAAAGRLPAETRRAARTAGARGARMVLERSWIVRTLAGYDCVVAYGMGPAWAAFGDVPYVAGTWGGDITMVPFYDTGDWEGHETTALPGAEAELFAQAKLQRLGYARAGRILLPDPRFMAFAERLGHAGKTENIGVFVDTERYAPGPEPELRRELLGDGEGAIVFMPSRQDWFWKGSDRLLKGFARAGANHPGAVLVCAGWGTDLERSRQLIAELGIGDRVKMLPYAMSKARLRRYYRAADVVADQFTVGSYGGSSLEAMSCARPLLIHLDPERFSGSFSLPPVVNVSEADEIALELGRLLADPVARAGVGERARAWTVANHGPVLVERTLDVCRAVIDAGARAR